MFTKLFWTLTFERAIKTFAQTLATVLIASGATLLTAGWTAALATAGMAAFVSILTSLGSLKIGPAGSPSVVATEEPPPDPAGVPAPVVLPVPPEPAPAHAVAA